MLDTTASATGVQIYVQVPGQVSTEPLDIPGEGSSTSIFVQGVVARGHNTPREPPKPSPSQLECGGASTTGTGASVDAPSQISSLGTVLKALLPLISWLGGCSRAVFPIIWINVLLLRRPLANASELEPILTKVENCRQEAHPFLCAGREPIGLPHSLLSLQRLWERYLEGKIKEQRFCSYGAGILVGSVCRTHLKTLSNCLLSFILGALQIAEKNDPLTRVFGFLAFAVLAFSLLANQLLSHHLDDKYIKEAHYAYHLLEKVKKEKTSTWNMNCVLSISSVSTWWAILLSTFTFASVFYDDTESVASSADSNIPLSSWEMVTSRVVMMAIFLISVSCLFAMHATLTRLCCLPSDCYLKTMLLDLPVQEGESQSANGD
ncbi:hypothetical protein DFH08DRAFT_502042 [Mycena albidolilacea]|uniref:Uncharacterized protein n=1 Tax=Mycena albidolilacea TaxID=1033008 RepID=A0AAD7ADF8_9AGAR|nr:hypothetical protein DFH08DRAFT_502042 [Mycena albidolilacea]